MKLTDYLALVRERLLVVVSVIAVASLASLALMYAQGERYVAHVRLRARPPAPGSELDDVLARVQQQTDLGTETELIRSLAVAKRVAGRLHYPGAPEDLLGSVSVSVLPNTTVMVVQGSAAQSQPAIALANAFAEEYLRVRRATLQKDLDRAAESQRGKLRSALSRLRDLDQRLATLPSGSTGATAASLERDDALAEVVVIRSRLDALGDRAALAAGFGEIIQPATRSQAVRSESPSRSLVFGGMIGVPLALAVVLLLDSLSNAIRSREDAERETGADVLGTIPRDLDWDDGEEPRLATSIDPFSPVAEAYRTLSHTLGQVTTERGVTTILVTSPGDGEGKTTTAANLALAYADSGRPVLLVEADLRRPRLHSFVGADPTPGVSDALTGSVPLAGAVQHLAPGFDFLPAGNVVDRPDLLVSRADVGGLLATLAQSDGEVRPRRRTVAPSIAPAAVLIDAAPILQAGEVSSLVAHVDGVVLVVRADVTTREAAARAAEQIRRAGGQLLGAVLIGDRSMGDVGSAAPMAGGRPRQRLAAVRRMARVG